MCICVFLVFGRRLNPFNIKALRDHAKIMTFLLASFEATGGAFHHPFFEDVISKYCPSVKPSHITWKFDESVPLALPSQTFQWKLNPADSKLWDELFTFTCFGLVKSEPQKAETKKSSTKKAEAEDKKADAKKAEADLRIRLFAQLFLFLNKLRLVCFCFSKIDFYFKL